MPEETDDLASTDQKTTTDVDEDSAEEEERNLGTFFSDEASSVLGPDIIMLLFAAALDIIGFILLIFLVDDFGILDIMGSFIYIWIFFRSGIVQTKKTRTAKVEKVTKKTTKAVSSVAKKINWLRWLSPIAELIPYFGLLYPGWTILVWNELKHSPQHT